MRLQRYLEPSLIHLDVETASKDELFDRVARSITERHPSLDAEELITALKAREAVGTTFLGGGVALPHARVNAQNEAVLSLVRLKTPIAFGDQTEDTAWLVVFTAVDAQSQNRHIQILARLSRVLHDAGDREAIRAARTSQEVIAILTRDDPPEDK